MEYNLEFALRYDTSFGLYLTCILGLKDRVDLNTSEVYFGAKDPLGFWSSIRLRKYVALYLVHT